MSDVARAKTVAYLNLVSIADFAVMVSSTGTRAGWKASIKTWTLNWGDGALTTGTGVPNPSQRGHTYAANGIYAASLKVTDTKNVTATAPLTISITTLDPVPPQPPTLYVLSVGNGSGSGSYPQGLSITITANPAPVGQTFSQWTGMTVASPTASTTTLIMPGQNSTVTARYVTVPATLTVICPTIAPTNSSNGQPVSVTYGTTAGNSATTTGGTAPVSIAYTPVSGSLFPVGSTQVSVLATDSLGATAACSFTVTIGGPVSATVVQPSDFTYLGSVNVPSAGEGGTYFGFSNARLSGRVVTGAIHLFLTQTNPSVGGQTDAVAELLYTNISTPLTLVTNWGDITKGQRVTQSPGALPMGGLYWDTVASQLWWTYGQVYSGNNVYNPSIGTSTLSGSDNSGVTAYGPWRLGPDVSQKTRGYLYPLRSDIVTALGGKRFAVGSPLTSGNSSSPWGAYAAAFTPPANGTTPSVVNDNASIAATCTDLIFTDIDHKQYRPGDTDQCAWLHYGETDTLGAQPQNNTTQDGTGCTVNGQLCGVTLISGPTAWLGIDTLATATGIYGATKSGVVYIGAVCRTLAGYTYPGNGRNHIWYGPTQASGQHLCPHGQNGYQYGQSTGEGTITMLSSLYIYDPADLLAVATGTKSATQLPPVTDGYDLSQIPHPNGASFPQVAESFAAYGGCWFEPTNKLLFVSDAARANGLPVIHVFSVNC